MNTPLSTKSIANYFIRSMNEKGMDVSPMKLQKLVYYAHGWHLGLTGRPLIPESVQAWQYGPVVESLYHDVKYWGSESISQTIGETVFEGGSLRLIVPMPEDPQIISFLDQIISIYGNFSAIQLSNMTHDPATPWAAVQSQFASEVDKRSVTIPDKLIEDHFKKLQEFASK